MPRELRRRASRPNYAALLRFEDESNNNAQAGPSRLPIEPEVDSGSDFAPEKDEVAQEEDEEIPADEDEPLDREESIASAARAGSKKPTKKSGKKGPSVIPGLSHPSTRQMHALPSVHHRHRAVPIYQRQGGVERLVHRPRLFQPPSVTATHGWAHDSEVTARVGKAWGYNVGPGPLWELIEDRGWFKEALASGDREDEASRRPRVHEDIHVKSDWEILNYSQASVYLPSDTNDADQARSRPPPVTCSFGPFGQQTKVMLNAFDTLKMETFFPGSRSHIFNAGAPVWGLDWCPIHPADRPARSFKQYLAIGPLTSRTHSPMIGVAVARPAHACIQIWALRPTTNSHGNLGRAEGDTVEDDNGEMRCEMVLCIESGAAHELRWCPLPSHDALEGLREQSHQPRKLGLLAGTFEDGSVSIYAVPDPDDMAARAGSDYDASQPIFAKLEPILRLELEETSCWSLDWGNSEVIAVGCTNGNIAVYNVGKALRAAQAGTSERVIPTHYLIVHQSAIRSLSWVRAPTFSGTGEVTADNPTVIASGGYDGMECVTDIRDPEGNVMNRTRDVVNSICYSAYVGSVVTIDHENMVKAFSLSPAMLGRGHTVLEPDGPVWNLHASEYHPQLAIGVSDGSLLTTNMLRSTRRGGSVPFLVHKIYQLDYSRKQGEYRMLEHFLPTEPQDRPTATRANKVLPVGTGAWPPEVGVQRVAWNAGSGLAGAPLLASATGSGLCRVDWLLGRWMRDRIPYNGVEGIRKEVDRDDFMDEESD